VVGYTSVFGKYRINDLPAYANAFPVQTWSTNYMTSWFQLLLDILRVTDIPRHWGYVIRPKLSGRCTDIHLPNESYRVCKLPHLDSYIFLAPSKKNWISPIVLHYSNLFVYACCFFTWNAMWSRTEVEK